MSDELTAAIETSIADLPGSDASSGGDGAPSPDPATPSGVPAATQTTPEFPATTTDPAKPPEEAATPLMPEGERPKRRGPIPLDRHETLLANAREEGQRAIAAAKAEHEAAMAQTRAELQAKQEMIALADRDPEMFLEALTRVDPRYAEAITKRAGGNGHAAAAATPGGAMPQPDRQFEDGSVGYSLEGLQKLLDWHASSVEDRVVQRYKPIEDQYRSGEAVRGAVQRVSAQVEAAKQWDGFTEHQGEIAAALKADRTLNLEGAYRQVVMPKLRASRDKMRAEILAEINGKPKTVTNTTPAGGVPPAASSDDLESIIRASIAHLPR